MYSAQSPDEIGLLEMARNLGFVFLSRTQDSITCKILNKTRTYRVLHEIPFSSDRKRMSVIIESEDGELLLLCKGADNVIAPRSNPEQRA